MCEAHIQDAPDDIPQSDSDVVTPEENKSKQETPPRKLIVQSRNGNWARKQENKRENPRHGCSRAHMCEAHIQDASDDIPQSDSDVVTPEQKKSKKIHPGNL